APRLGLPPLWAPARHSAPARGAPPRPATRGLPRDPAVTAGLPAGSNDNSHLGVRSRRSAWIRTAVAASRPVTPPRYACHRRDSAAPPSGTRSPARPAAATPPPDAARPDHDGGRGVQETAADNAGSAPAPRPRPRPPARPAVARG